MTTSTSALTAAQQHLQEHPQEAVGPVIPTREWGFDTQAATGRWLARLCTFIQRLCAVVLAVVAVLQWQALRRGNATPACAAVEDAGGLL